MTLISNEIHMLDGFKRTLLIFAADRRLTYPDGSYAGSKQKLFPISYLSGGVSYFGLAEVYPKRKKQYLSDWLREFVIRHSTMASLKDFAFQLRDELHTIINWRTWSVSNLSSWHTFIRNSRGGRSLEDQSMLSACPRHC